MSFSPLDFSRFEGRENELKNIIRYHKYPVMYYRTNLLVHSRRLVWMIETFAKDILNVYPNFDIEKCRAMVAIHDDPEIITGDIQFGAKLKMSKEERQKVSDDERRAIAIIADRYPSTINGFSYRDLLYEYEDMQPDNLEGTVAKYFDKMEGLCEAIHELSAGNDCFVKGFATDITSPVDIYCRVFNKFTDTWPLFVPLRASGLPIFSLPIKPDVSELVRNGQPHTASSIKTPTSLPHYDIWREVTVNRGKEAGIALLTEKKE